ncbi:uncharacterized protein [Asterias amurensis]|uniref:uncharacterized protein n=1 Tax=Asterias amurensis TaxID=7602 RepID=UPI003AB83395
MFAQEGLRIVQSSNTSSKGLEILKNRQKHLHEYKNINEEKKVDLTYDLSFLSFKESQNRIGIILLKEKWEERVTTRVGGECIGTFSTGDLLVVGNGKDTILTIINSKGTVSHTYGQSWFRGNLHNPVSLAVNTDDQIIFLDGPTVKTFGSNCRLLRQFSPGKESGSKPTCLAVDENNLIAVGYKDKGEVSLHNPDGSLIRTLSAPGIDKYMIMNNQRIIYTSSSENVSMCASVNGTNKCTVFLRFGNVTLYGICCDKVGDVYIIVNVDLSKCSPWFSQSDKGPFQRSYLQWDNFARDDPSKNSTAKKHCISRYRFGTDFKILARSNDTFHDVTYTPNGHLAVVGENCTKLFQRV